MIIKSASFLYLFDFDGTLTGTDDWSGFFKNFQLCFQKLHINPSVFDIRWCILTSRPRMDRWLIKLVCKKHGLTPKQIITGPTFTWKFKDIKQEAKYKEKIIKQILNGDFKITYTSAKITKVCYIDNNVDAMVYLNGVRDDYKYIAMSVSDFITKDFTQIIL